MERRGELPEEDEDAGVHTNHVQHKDVATPCSSHEDVADSCQNTPDLCVRGQLRWVLRCTTECTHPEVERHHHARHRDRLVVVATADRPHDVRWYNGEDQGRNHTGVCRAGALPSPEPHEEGCSNTTPARHVTANVVERNLISYSVERVLDGDGSDLHPWVDRGADRTAKRIPRLVVKPVEERGPAVVVEVLGGTVIEPWIKLVDHKAIRVDGVQLRAVALHRR